LRGWKSTATWAFAGMSPAVDGGSKRPIATAATHPTASLMLVSTLALTCAGATVRPVPKSTAARLQPLKALLTLAVCRTPAATTSCSRSLPPNQSRWPLASARPVQVFHCAPVVPASRGPRSTAVAATNVSPPVVALALTVYGRK